MQSVRSEPRRLLDALARIDGALGENIERSLEIRRRLQGIRIQLANGEAIHDVVATEPVPRSVEMLTTNMAVLETVGSDFRFELAQALRDEGLTIETIADLFGVTRQRVSALLRQRRSST